MLVFIITQSNTKCSDLAKMYKKLFPFSCNVGDQKEKPGTLCGNVLNQEATVGKVLPGQNLQLDDEKNRLCSVFYRFLPTKHHHFLFYLLCFITQRLDSEGPTLQNR